MFIFFCRFQIYIFACNIIKITHSVFK
ncbi:polyprotein [Staphylococcus phage JPL-50]|uniref:Polyprotein n=1 Tax=Staphylococcus phage JPL-50 TaxID=2851077 RepID=A0A8F3C9Q3_9CAUD|nr:polyprotein [Staphylococcus phage JPL-50]QWY14508.1 polyprotein [Staphylococcus phage JPL-50]